MIKPTTGGPGVDPSFDYLKSFMFPDGFEETESFTEGKGAASVKVNFQKFRDVLAEVRFKSIRKSGG